MPAPSAPYFADQLLHWYQTHQRDLPWRHTRDPYLIWLSEIILQQTRVQQGLPYYYTFANAYPTVQHLANAPEDEVLRHWQGLGYYSRARNLHHTAKFIANELGGHFPESYAGLLKLKGIGTYTAAAIASFAYTEPVAVLDGNVYRVLARYFGIDHNIALPASKKVFQKLAAACLPAQQPDQFNQAIMEFGAMQCKPVNPLCETCPLADSCFAYQHQAQHTLPVKIKPKQNRLRHFTYLVLHHKGMLYMHKRGAKDIWRGLYDFPLIETEMPTVPGPLFMPDTLLKGMPEGSVLQQVSTERRHQLSHQQVRAVFCKILLPAPLTSEQEQTLQVQAFSLEQAEQLGKPILVVNYLKNEAF